ncbi:MAG: DUF4124 domain-containing protein [Gammaproteobacteria bacterium]|nr:DUF4124 domain-containing protein [Gammaproteobacteria bacterium]
MLKKIALVWVAVFLAAASLAVSAGIYRWVDESGRVHFTDKPPQEVGAESVSIIINTYTAPQILETTRDVKSGRKVIMYSTVWCGVCKKAKAYFTRKNIPYKEYDVERDAKGIRDFKAMGGRGVPVILVGNRRMNGFTAESFEKLYGT